MSKEREVNGIFDSMPPEPPPVGAEGASVPLADKPEFDPYKFQHLTVSPTLRHELSAAKLPRLDPEFFVEDTVRPNQGVRSPEKAPMAAPTTAPMTAPADGGDDVGLGISSAPALPSRKKKHVIIATIVGLSLGAVFAAVGAWTHESPPPTEEPGARPADVAIEPAVQPALAPNVGSSIAPAVVVEPSPAPDAPAAVPNPPEIAPEPTARAPKAAHHRAAAPSSRNARKGSVFDTPLVPPATQSAP